MILVSLGVLLPVLVLTYLQYRSLTELANKTKGAYKDTLRQRLTDVRLQMKQRLEDVAAQKSNPAGVRRFENYAADAHLCSLFERSRTAQSFLDDNHNYLLVHEPEGIYIFHANGSAGVLLDERFVADDLIAGSVKAAITPPGIAITISDEKQRVLYSNAVPKQGYILEDNFDPPFSNWKAGIGLKTASIEDLGRDSFRHSVMATVLVLILLFGGVVLIVRATDREARLAQAKANFVANVSHELKTPLSLLSLFSEILELGRVKNDEKRMEYYRVMRHESRRLNKLIDNILDFSKIEAGRKTYNFADGDMAEVIENVLASYRYQIVNLGFQIETNIQPDLPPVSIDREAMAQAISNLLDNAIKYSRDVKQLSISTDRRGSDLSVEIADRGIGIPRAEQAKIFEKFYRVGNGLVHDVKGSGLGLSLVKHIIEAHKGTISVESDVGKGSRFTIMLPLARKNGDAASSVQE
ncbi:MAG TPA: HAMP domain-containing sensor histidine kinase [Pyrinomonadaceae bacterium]|nr:HAMP domain-containing sensor histidine kinase [Pyrinomonadaceae bacterium]